jgi:hypothetical protein
MVLRLKKLAARSGSSAALHRFIGHILLSVLSGNTCVLPTLQFALYVPTRVKMASSHFHVSSFFAAYTWIRHSCMGEFRDMGIPAQVVKKKSCTSGEAASAGFFFATRAGIPMSLNSPMQEWYSSMSRYIINIFLDFFKFRVIFSVKQLPPACSHANSNMSSQRNFRNPTHGSEVVNATKIPKKIQQIALRKVEKSVKKYIFH